jgi:dynein heavy chain 1
VDPKQVNDADVVITTVDTNRHQTVLCSWLQEKRPFLLCGPPGSGKTMTLMATLKMVTDMEMIFINFSSQTSPSLVLKTFDHYCEVKKTNTGLVMTPL